MFFNKTNYLIKQGKHKPTGINFGFNWANTNVSFTFRIPKHYKREDVGKTGVNKIFGYSIGVLPKIKKFDEKYSKIWFKIPLTKYCVITPVHWNSVRIGYQSHFKSAIPKNVIYDYVYEEGIRYVTTLLACYYDETINVIIKADKNGKKRIHLLDKVFISKSTKKVTVGHRLDPYFGGESVSPFDINYYLKKH